jgi:type IV secretory pathway TrbD component
MEASMPVERETIVERAPNETVVVGGGISPLGIIGGIIALVIAVLLILWLANGGISSNGDAVNVDLPNVTVTK